MFFLFLCVIYMFVTFWFDLFNFILLLFKSVGGGGEFTFTFESIQFSFHYSCLLWSIVFLILLFSCWSSCCFLGTNERRSVYPRITENITTALNKIKNMKNQWRKRIMFYFYITFDLKDFHNINNQNLHAIYSYLLLNTCSSCFKNINHVSTLLSFNVKMWSAELPDSIQHELCSCLRRKDL